MAITVNNDTAIHEAAHCIFAYVASDIFETELVTCNTSHSKTFDPLSLGGIKGHLIRNGNKFTFEEHDLIILILLAGMAADDINDNDGKLHEGLYDNALFLRKIESNKYSGDFKLLLPHLKRIMNVARVSQREYTKSCQKTLHEIFSTEPLLSVLVQLRHKIVDSPGQTMNGLELREFLNATELREWKQNQWPTIAKLRSQSMKRRNLIEFLLDIFRIRNK